MKKENKIKKSLRASFADGIFASCMLGFTTEYIIPYALALKAQVSQIGVLSAFPNLAASLSQLKSADITDRIGSRKKVILFFVLLHLLMGIPIILTPYLFKGLQVWSLIIFVTLFTCFNAVAGPAWLSLMSDYIPPAKRGWYFGWRNKILGIIATSCLFIAGFILHLFKNNILRGFLVIFSIAFICRMISWHFLTRMYETPLKTKQQDYFSFPDFIKGITSSNFGRFVLFVAGMSFCVNIAAPFFSVFMLRDLKFSYITYTILVTAVSITSIFTIHRWGRNADRIGNVKVLKITSLLISFLPILWIINRNPFYLFFAQVLSGFAWAGFNLSVINFIYDAVSPQKRTRCFAFFNVINGLAVCLGALTGGYLTSRLPALFGYKILSLFLIAGTLRLAVSLTLSARIKEVRSVQDINARDLLFSVMGLEPIISSTQE